MADGFQSYGFYSNSNPALQLHLPQTEEERSGSDVHDAIAQIQEKIERIVQDTVKVQLYACAKFMRFSKIWLLNKYMRFLFMRYCQPNT